MCNAIIKEDVKAVKNIVTGKVNLNVKIHVNEDQWLSPLNLAVELNYTDIVFMLLDAGADPNMAVGDKLMTPLMIAAQKGHVESLRILTKKEVEFNAEDSNGDTALHHTALHNNPKCMTLLLT